MTPRAHLPVLHLLAGINGAGKTSFYEDVLRPRTPGAEFVNADEIERRLHPGEVGSHSYEAAELAARRRAELIAAGISFVTETVFSHPSKLELVLRAQRAGFFVTLYHIHVSTIALANERIRTRVSAGGHDVPRSKVRERFPRTLALLREAALRADRAFVYDNSRLDVGFTHVLTFEAGALRRIGTYMPHWVEDVYADALAAARSPASRPAPGRSPRRRR